MSNGITGFITHTASRVVHKVKRLLAYQPKVQLKHRNIRVSGHEGYVHAAYDSDILPNKPVVYSFGVGTEATYELEMIRDYGAQVYAFDPTPKSIAWVQQNIDSENFHFYPYGLSDRDEQEKFYLPENPEYVSGSIVAREGLSKENFVMAEMRRLSSIMHELGHEKLDILKLDVQGSEFKAVPEILNSGVEFMQLSLGVYFSMFADGINKTKSLLSLLNEHGYYTVYSDRVANHYQLLLIRK